MHEMRNRIPVTATELIAQSLKMDLTMDVTVDPNQTVSQAVKTLGLLSTDGVLPVVNGHLEDWDYFLKEGDELHLVQVISGG